MHSTPSIASTLKQDYTLNSLKTNRHSYFGENCRSTFYAKYKTLSKQTTGFNKQEVNFIQTVNNALDTYAQSALPPIQRSSDVGVLGTGTRMSVCDDSVDDGVLFLTEAVNNHENDSHDANNHSDTSSARETEIETEYDNRMDSHAEKMCVYCQHIHMYSIYLL